MVTPAIGGIPSRRFAMFRNKRFLLAAAAFVFIAGLAALALAFQGHASATAGVPDTEDSRLIQETIYRSFELQHQAVLTMDTSAFSTVFVNDPRGGPLLPTQIQHMQEVTGELAKTDFGYLDFQVEFFTVRPAPEEAELALDSDGGVAVLRPTPPGVHVLRSAPLELRFISIVIEGDRAVATLDTGSSLREMVLVRLDGKWLIAGSKVIRAWP
jgi:hypothetical protein